MSIISIKISIFNEHVSCISQTTQITDKLLRNTIINYAYHMRSINFIMSSTTLCQKGDTTLLSIA